MKNQIQNAFHDIKADDELLAKTTAYLQEERIKPGKRRKSRRSFRIAGTLAAMLILTVGIFGYRTFYSEAAAYVSIDVNPSIELTLNRRDEVIAATAYNTDGKNILQQVDIDGKQYDEAASILLVEMNRQGYISSSALITMTVQTKDGAKEQTLCDALLQLADKQTASVSPAAEIEVFPVTQEVRETAQGCHMSAAKYLAIQDLIAVDETATVEAYSDSSIHQIRQRTQECREEHGNGSGSSGEDNGSSGNGNQDTGNHGSGNQNGNNQGGRTAEPHGHNGRHNGGQR